MKNSIITKLLTVILITVMLFSCGVLTACSDKESSDVQKVEENKEDNSDEFEEGYEEDYNEAEDYTLKDAVKSDEYRLWYRLSGSFSVAKDAPIVWIYIFDKEKDVAEIYTTDEQSIIDLGTVSKKSDDEIFKMLKNDPAIKKEKLPFKIHVYTDDTGNNVISEAIEFDHHHDYDIEFDEDVYGEVYDAAFKGVGCTSYIESGGAKNIVVTEASNEESFTYDDVDAEGVVVD